MKYYITVAEVWSALCGRAAGTNLLIMPSLFSSPLGQEEAGLSWSRLDCEVTVIVVTVVVAVKPKKLLST